MSTPADNVDPNKPVRIGLVQFEGLFKRALDCPNELKAEFKKLGYDMGAEVSMYDERVFAACVNAAARHFFPAMNAFEAHRALGRATVEGGTKTLAGSIFLPALKLASAKRVLALLPRFSRGSQENFEMELVEATDSEAAIEYHLGGRDIPHFHAGCAERFVEFTGVTAKATVKYLPNRNFRVLLSWTVPRRGA